MRKKKAAPLTGSLLTQDETDRSTGFVISLVDRLKDAQTAADGPEQPNRTAKSPRAKEPSTANPSVDIVDSIRPKPGGREAAGDSGPDPTNGASGGSPGRRPPADDRRPAAALGEDDSRSQAPLIVQALRNGDLERAETMFGRLTGLNARHVRRVLYGAEGRNLAIACRALGIEQLQFVSIFMLSRRLGLGEQSLEPRRLTHIASYFEQTDEAAARETLNQWLCYSGD